ncbi:MAG: hypothetical protein AABX23_01200 [Nanoarchaeota archaeon]
MDRQTEQGADYVCRLVRHPQGRYFIGITGFKAEWVRYPDGADNGLKIRMIDGILLEGRSFHEAFGKLPGTMEALLSKRDKEIFYKVD